MEAMEAIREAARIRTRPMILTHLTTLLALIPASLGLGDGPQLLQPLGIMLLGGLTTGTLFTLNLCLPSIWPRNDGGKILCKQYIAHNHGKHTPC